MSNKVSTDLFDLIKSLGKSEKRYFKVFSSRHTIGKENNYIQLFDFIDRMNQYDEEAIFKKFKGEAFLNKFSITKGRLYDNVLRSLDSFYAQKSIDSQIFRLIHSADILYKKSLYSQCLKLLRSASKLANKHDKFTLILEIHLKKKKLIENHGYMKIKEDEIESYWENEQVELTRISQYFELWYHKSKLFYQLNKFGQARNEEELAELKSLVEKLPEEPNEQAYFDSKYLHYHIHSAYNFGIGNFEKSFEYLIRNVDLFQSQPAKICDEPNLYYSILTNAIYLASKLGDTRLNEYLKELKEFPVKYKIDINEDLAIKLFSSSKSLEFSLFSQSGDFDEILKQQEELLDGYDKFNGKLSTIRKAHLNFQVSIAHFAVGNFNDALKWNNKVINEMALGKGDDILCFAHIVNLIIHLELDNKRLLPYAIKSTKRLLKSRTNGYELEKIFLKHLNKLIASRDYFEFQEKLDFVLEELELLKEKPMEKIAFDYFDFASWILAKKKQKSYQEIILNQAS